MLTQAGEREGYSSHNWGVWGVPAVAEASRKLLQPEVCRAFSQGSWPQIMGPLAVVGSTGSREGVGCDLHLLTGLSAAAAAAVAPASGILGSSCGSHG